MFLDKDQTVTFCTALSSHYRMLWDAVECWTGCCGMLWDVRDTVGHCGGLQRLPNHCADLDSIV